MLASIVGGRVEYLGWIGDQVFQKSIDRCRLVLILRVFGVYDIVGGIATSEKSSGVRD